MRISKQNKIIKIKELVEQMESILVEAKAKGKLFIHDDAIKLDAETVSDAFIWICNVYETLYKDVTTVKRLLPDELWERYRTWPGFEEHREVVMLTKALRALRLVCISRMRPIFFKSTMVKELLSNDKRKRKNKKDNTPRSNDD